MTWMKKKTGIFFKFSDDIKLGGIVDTSQDRSRIQDDLDSLEHWANTNRMGFNRGEMQISKFRQEK